MAGRPTKLTKETTKLICEAVEEGATYKDAAAFAGISLSIFSEWMSNGRNSTRKNKFTEFLGAVEEANARCRVAMAAVITNAGKSGDWRAAESFLKRRDPEAWGDKQEVKTDGDMKVIVEYADSKDNSADPA